MRQPALLVEFDDGGLSIRPQLSRCGAEGVGRLQGVPPLNAALAPAAPADVDVELAVNGLARDLHLVLLGDVGFVEWGAAVGAALGQRCLVNLVDLFGTGRPAVGFGAVVLAWLAAGLLRLGRRLALGERGGLALAGARRLVELTPEPLVLGLEVVDPPLKGFAVGTSDRLHDGIVRSSGRCSGPERVGGSISPGFRR